MSILPIYCEKCEAHEFSVDTEKLDYPFCSDMFPVEVECIHSRTWQFPKGPVNMELTCPGCGGFPFEFRDGVPTGRLKVKLENDRFPRLIHWQELKAFSENITVETVESLGIDEFKPKKKEAIHGRDGRGRKEKRRQVA